MKKFIESLMAKITKSVRRSNTDPDSCMGSIAFGASRIDLEDFNDAVDFLTRIGFYISFEGNKKPNQFVIEWDQKTDRSYMVGLTILRANTQGIIDLYKTIKSLGISGILIVQAYLDAIINLDADTFRLMSSNLDGINYLKDYVIEFLEVYRLPRKITKRAMNTIIKSLGGYKSIQGHFWQMIHEYKEFILGHEYRFHPKYSVCNICKYSAINETCCRYCTKCRVEIDPRMTISEMGTCYSDSDIVIENGIPRSEWLVKPLDSCPHMADRRPFIPKETHDIPRGMIKQDIGRGQIRMISNQKLRNHDDEQSIM